ncbi:MAG: hypothetical protein IPG61_19245 [bacterium]|nr:hypothetical protein [bacterium]
MTTVQGNLYIGPSRDIRDLSPLVALDSLRGTLSIVRNDSLMSLVGLGEVGTNVVSVQISYNPSAAESARTPRICARSGMMANSKLTGVRIGQPDGLPTSCFNVVRIAQLPALEGLGGLRGQSGMAELVLYDLPANCTLGELPALPDLESLELTRLSGVRRLDDLRGLSGLHSLKINYCDSLTSLEGLGEAGSVDNLNLYSLPSLRSLTGLEGLTSLPNLNVFDCDVLIDLSALGFIPDCSTCLSWPARASSTCRRWVRYLHWRDCTWATWTGSCPCRARRRWISFGRSGSVAATS